MKIMRSDVLEMHFWEAELKADLAIW